MKVGKTIGAKREQAETESERMQYREKVKRRKMISVMTYLIILAVIALGIAMIIVSIQKKELALENEGKDKVGPTIEIVDEASVGVSRKVREYVGYLEQDLHDYGITLTRAVLPRDKSREVDVYIADFEGYFKLSLDRGAGVSAEDLERMLRYLRGLGAKGVEYVDLRVEGKGYYKGLITEERPAEEQGSSEESQPEEEQGEIVVVEEETGGENGELTGVEEYTTEVYGEEY